MTPETYNNIREFTPELPFKENMIEQVGNIIRRHSLENQIAVLYVHRHFDMPANSIAIEEKPVKGIRVIRMPQLTTVKPQEINGISFKLMETGKFQAFEYSTQSTTPTFPSEFLKELAQFINDHNLADVLGISVRSDKDDLLTSELNLFGPKLSVSIPTGELPPDLQEHSTPTNWLFRGDVKASGNSESDESTEGKSAGSWQGLSQCQSQCVYMCGDRQCTYMCPRSCTWMCRGMITESRLNTIVNDAFQRRGLVF